MSKLKDTQQRLADLLNTDLYFNDPIPAKKILAITQRKGDIVKVVQESMIRAGVGVIVMMPAGTSECLQERKMLGLKFGVIIAENPMVNQSPTGIGKAAEDILEKVIQLIHWQPNNALANPKNQSSLFKLSKDAFRQLPPAPNAPLNYIVNFITSVTI